MYYFRLTSTGEVLGAAMSGMQGAEWIERYAANLSVDPVDIEQFESNTDPRLSDAQTEPPPPKRPDPNGLLLAVFQTFGKTKARSLATQYPDFQLGLERANWPVAREAVEDAHTSGDMTVDDYDTIQGLLTEYGIPEA